MLNFLPLGATGYGLLLGRTLPAAQQRREDASGTGRVGVPRTSGYLANALGFESGRIFFAGDKLAVSWFLLSYGQRKRKLLAVHFHHTTSARTGQGFYFMVSSVLVLLI